MSPDDVAARPALTAAARSAGRGAAWQLPLAQALLLALPLLLGLGGAPLFDVDEGAFAEASREMLASGDFGHTMLNGLDRFDKPIGVYWLQVAALALFGPGAWAVRLPSALALWALAWALLRFVAPRWGAATGWRAALVLVTALGPLLIGRAATADALLNLLIGLAGMDLWRCAESAGPAGAGDKTALRRAAVWIALGLLVKGPVALLVPGAALLLYALWTRRWPLLRGALGDPGAWLLLLVIATPWYAYAWQRHGMAFVDGFLLHHNVQRFTGALEGHGGGLAYHLLLLPLLWWPWSPLMLGWWARRREALADLLARYALGWLGFVLLFFSFSGTKLPHYGLYAAVPMALLLGRMLDQAGASLRLLLWAAWVPVLAGLLLLPALLPAQAGRIADPLYRALLQGAPGLQPPAADAAALVLALLLGAAGWRALALSGAAERFGIAAWIGAMLVGGLLSPWAGEALQGPVQRAAQQARERGGTLVQDGVNLPSAAFYAQAPTPRRPARPGELALVRVDRLPPGAASGTDSTQWTWLRQERGLALLQRRSVP